MAKGRSRKGPRKSQIDYSQLPFSKPGREVKPQAVEDARRTYCVWCGIPKTRAKLEQHHIDSVGSGGSDHDTITLCTGPPNDCHGKAQQYKISREDLRKEKEIDERLSRDPGAGKPYP